jgi:predicted Zn-dependent protease
MRALSIIVLSAVVGACASPEYNAPEVSQDEVAARQSAQVPLRAVPRSFAEHQARVARVEARLRNAAGPICKEVSGKECGFHVVVKDEDTINAYAVPGGKIIMYTGLMNYLASDDEVAAVLAHEMSHHAANHLEEGMRNTAIGSVVGGVLVGVLVAAAGGDPTSVRTGTRTGADVGAAIGNRAYSQEEESEADYLGAYIMARAGYDVDAAVAIHDKLDRLKAKGGDNAFSFGSTHPSSPEREARITKTKQEIALKKAMGNNLLPKKRPLSSK